jgi:radical SAM family RiPP maturation amino acid epimerase
MERWTCDRSFREDLAVDPRAAAAARGIVIDPEELRVFWDKKFRVGIEELPTPDALRKITALGLVWIGLRQRVSEAAKSARTDSIPADARFAGWREQQIARCNVAFHPRFAEAIPHIPFAIELSKGCSVGCWFCGVSAPRLDGHYPYSEENGRSFKRILETLARLAGRSAGKWGILYWATDPFDHPDYERFGSDFARVFGAFPATTTALAWKDMARTKHLIRLAAIDGLGRLAPARVRFSILNVRILDRYLSELSEAELAAVSFQAINNESIIPTSESGRARQNRPMSWGTANKAGSAETSIACMSGFLLNLVDKSVRLISPCPSDERWPDGYIVYDEAAFMGADDLPRVLEQMIDRNMSAAPS